EGPVFQREEEVAMPAVNSSVAGARSALARLAVLMVVVQAVGLGSGWSQEPAHSALGEEIAKQDKIYHSRSTDGGAPYTTNRGLSRYAELLPSGFCDDLGKLGSSDRWLDIGAGEGHAVLDYHAPEQTAPPAEKCAGSGPRARAVAISIED